MGNDFGCSSCNNDPGNIKVPNSDIEVENSQIIGNSQMKQFNNEEVFNNINNNNIKDEIYEESIKEDDILKSQPKKKEEPILSEDEIFDINIQKIAKKVSDSEILQLTNDNIKNLEKSISKFNDDDSSNYPDTIKRDSYKFTNDNSIYKGSWNKNGKKEGFGIYIDKNGNKYSGYFLNDLFNGKGRLINSNGDYFEGEFINGNANGKGILKLKEGYIYEGEFKDDKPNGFGKENFPNKSVFEGNFINGIREGEGEFKWDDGSIYKGNFNNGNLNGQGNFIWNDGRNYIGNFNKGQMEGKGEFNWPNGNKYIGNYKLSKKEGFGIYYWSKNIYFEGNWVNNMQHGDGIYYNQNRVIKGVFRYGKLIQCNEEKNIDENNNDNDKNYNVEEDNDKNLKKKSDVKKDKIINFKNNKPNPMGMVINNKLGQKKKFEEMGKVEKEFNEKKISNVGGNFAEEEED